MKGLKRTITCGEAALAHVGAAAGHRDDVGVHSGDGVVHVVHVGLLDRDQHLLANGERRRPLLDLVA